MARLPRVAVAEVAYHVTQRDNGRHESGQNKPVQRSVCPRVPDGGKTIMDYNDGAPKPSIVTTKHNTTDLVTTTVMNGLGQVIGTQLTSDTEGVVYNDLTYDGFGRKYQVYNPYRGSQGPYTMYTYDTAGRLKRTDNPDGTYSTSTFLSNCATFTVYNADNSVVSTTKKCYEDLGRLNSVTEDPGGLGYVTNYTYDLMDKLLTVSQGSQTRTFTYDSFSNIYSESNPENGTTFYYYAYSPSPGGAYCGGNKLSPCTRLDANGKYTYYIYDNDNRLLTKSYAASDPTTRACYAYDGQAGTGWGNAMSNPIGHMTSSYGITHAGTVVASNETFAWDTMGRPLGEMQCTPSTCSSSKGYPDYNTYDLLGNVTSSWDSSYATYPTYDAANRLNGLTVSTNVNPGVPGPGSSVVSISAHSPFGGPTSGSYGTGQTETRSYTPRGVIGSLVVPGAYAFSLTYDGGGNVLTANDYVNGNWTYTYDKVNRLHTAAVSGATFTYSYDQFGNMTCSYGPRACTPISFAISPTTNRITTSGYTYDANGNLLTDNTRGYVYDTENRLTCVVDPSGGLCTTSGATVFTYDADGRRVSKAQGNGTLIEDEVYDLQGHQTSAHNGSTVLRAEIYAPSGWHLGTYSGTTLYYLHTDWLGSFRADSSTGNCLDDPFGMNLRCTYTANPTPTLYTGQQHDSETGLDDFHARYYGAARNVGRFMTADPSGKGAANLEDPQTWNLYAYVRNNPLSLTDPSGLQSLTPDPAHAACPASPTGCGGGPNAGDGQDPTFGGDLTTGANGTPTLQGTLPAPSGDFLVGTAFGGLGGLTDALGDMFENAFTSEVSTTAASAGGAAAGEGAAAGGGSAAGSGGKNFVYAIVQEGKTVYVGITNSLERRATEHGADLTKIASGLTRQEARGAEQALIEKLGLAKNGGSLLNKINSIAATTPIYNEAVAVGRAILQSQGW